MEQFDSLYKQIQALREKEKSLMEEYRNLQCSDCNLTYDEKHDMTVEINRELKVVKEELCKLGDKLHDLMPNKEEWNLYS
ncbi:hypothetical protein D3C74_91470 [compost metagenome]